MWLNRWNYLETIQPAQETNQRHKTFLLVLERILEVGPDTELVSAVVRLSDLVVPSMIEEKDPVVRRKQELVSNTVRHNIIENSAFVLCHVKVMEHLLNLSSPGPLLWSRYQAVTECRHRLRPEVSLLRLILSKN